MAIQISSPIDWTKIRTIEDLDKIPQHLLYDNSVEVPADWLKIRDDITLTSDEIEEALFMKNYTRGIMLVTGMAGQGKGMFVHQWAYKLRRYFGLNIITDTRPRPLMGRCIPFSRAFYVEQIKRMHEVATGIKWEGNWVKLECVECGNETILKKDKKLIKCSNCNGVMKETVESELVNDIIPAQLPDGRWMSSRGEVFIRRAVWILDEFGSKYMSRMDVMNPIHRDLLTKLFPIWRHLQSMIIGVGQEMAELDPHCFDKLTSKVECTKLLDKGKPERLIFRAKLYPLRFISSIGELEVKGKVVRLLIDGDKPRDYLGGKAFHDLYNHQQAVALDLAAGLKDE